MRIAARLIPVLLCALQASSARAATRLLTPSDSYQVLESAQPGDVVEIAPGTYRFRVFLNRKASSSNPITIRAQDPASRPVWDLGGKNVDAWPGSYTGGDRSRGAWQVFGTGYRISDIIFRNATNGVNAAGLRVNGGSDVIVRNCLFQFNDNGFSGKGEDILLEFCEMDRNGKPGSSHMTHNIYNYGGSLTVRHCYLHDPTHGQNFHIRAREALIEYCWIARAKSYDGDVMTGPEQPQKLTLRGNVIIQSANPGNGSKLFTMHNDTGASGVRMQIDLFYNTILGNGTSDTAVVAMRNDNMAHSGSVMSNNILYKVRRAMTNRGGSNWSFSGSNNWLNQGNDATGLSRTFFGSDPGFQALGSRDFSLVQGASAAGKADPSLGGPCEREYYRDEQVRMRYRFRLASRDLGAFESTTSGADYGAYDAAPADHVPPQKPRNLRLAGE